MCRGKGRLFLEDRLPYHRGKIEEPLSDNMIWFALSCLQDGSTFFLDHVVNERMSSAIYLTPGGDAYYQNSHNLFFMMRKYAVIAHPITPKDVSVGR